MQLDQLSARSPQIANCMRQDALLNVPDEATFQMPGAKGCADYPTLAA